MEGQVDEAKLAKSSVESDWRRRYETEKAQLKLSASHDRMELMNKLQEDNRDQLKSLREELNAQHEKVCFYVLEDIISTAECLSSLVCGFALYFTNASSVMLVHNFL